MAYKTLIFGTDDIYPKLKPFYDAEVKRGNLEIVARAELEKDKINIIYSDGRQGELNEILDFDLAIISSKKIFYERMKLLEAMKFPREKILDGLVFRVQNLNFSRFLTEKVAYGVLEKPAFKLGLQTVYPQFYSVKDRNLKLSLGARSYINDAEIEGAGEVHIKNFCPIARKILFVLGENRDHNYRKVSSCPAWYFGWASRKEFLPPQGTCKILIGNDVWVGRRCVFKCTNPDKPLIIGDGAVIAADSVVVKNVPPYAIVGGNPAQVIKYRFSPEIIEAFLRIKWWDWDLDKLNENFKYFNDVEKFISLHDKELNS